MLVDSDTKVVRKCGVLPSRVSGGMRGTSIGLQRAELPPQGSCVIKSARRLRRRPLNELLGANASENRPPNHPYL